VPTVPSVVPLIERIRRATLGRFDVITTLGEGGMATVFLARDLALDRQVAIKVMHPGLMSSPAAIGRFRREARVVAALDHPNIISIYAVGEDAELAFYVMRYVEGRSLHHVIAEDGPLSFRRVESIVTAVGNALHYAHRRGVVHRDVKPANIMLDQDDWVIVTDFGIAKLDEADRLTLSGHVFGTPHYMSPEYFNGGVIGAGSDQYALGVVAVELLTGTTPFPGDTIGEVMRGHLFDPIPSVPAMRPDLPPEVGECLTRMLAKEPSKRYVSVADAVAAFRAAGRRGESSVATELIDTPTSGRLRIPVLHPDRDAGVRRRRDRIAALAAVATILATVAVLTSDAIAMRSRGPESERLGAQATTEAVRAEDAAEHVASENAGREDAAPEAAAPENAGPANAPGNATQASATPDEPAPSRRVAAAPAAPATTSGAPGTVRLGSRLPLAVLYIGNERPRLIGEQGIQSLEVAAGPARLAIRLDGCTPWDTTFTVRAGATHTIGYRAPKC
jgi:eukaryotic-like serine/threonine-protein kinase